LDTRRAVKAAPTVVAAATTGSQWPDGQGVVYRATGRILFAMAGGYWICSGTVVTETATDRSIVLTAAHCAYDQAAKQFATNWMFIPEFDTAPVLFDCANTALGCWTASSLVVSAGFANRGGFDTTAAQSDWAFAVLGPGGKTATALDTTVGSFPISFSSVSQNTAVSALGYPAGAPYDGTELIHCQGALKFDFWTLNRTYRLPCTMTGGSSGGPWLRSFATNGNTGTLMSVNSYTYAGGGSMYGPKFTSRTQAAWNASLTTATNTVVP
jgi:V8-like Glu-specific endopeptidase